MKLKKILAVALVLVMVLSFAACTKSSSNEIVIGVSGPLTGSAAQYGNAVVNAAKLAVDEINEAGGVNGTKLKLISADDEADSGEKAVSAYNSLKDQGMQIFLGTVTSGSCLAVIDKTKEDNMFQLTPSASADGVIKNDNCFQICFTDSNQGVGSAQYIAENKLATKVGVIYDSSDAYSSGIFNQFKKAAADKSLEIVAEQAFTKDSNKDFSAQVKACKEAGADLVFLPIYYTEASLVLQAAAKAEYDVKFFGCDGLDGILAVENFDKKLAEGVMLLTPFAADAQDKLTQDFVNSYKAKYNEVPNQFAADAYDGIYIIKAAIEKAGATPDMSTEELCNAIKGAMTQITVDGVTGLGMTWTADGEPNKAPKGMKIQNGAYVAM